MAKPPSEPFVSNHIPAQQEKKDGKIDKHLSFKNLRLVQEQHL